VDVDLYREQRQKLKEEQPVFRNLCLTCLQPEFGCYCAQVKKFDPNIKFVILIHPIEARRRIATGRMSHLCLQNSALIRGQDYSQNLEVEAIIQNPNHHSVILYPGNQSLNLSHIAKEDQLNLFPRDKKLVIFVIDGTWATAKKMLNQSTNLQKLSRICFSPSKPSNFRVRKQPAPGCYSTVEAIHQTIELVGSQVGFAVEGRQHDGLLSVFDYMVEKQLTFVHRSERRFLKRKRSA
jgi:DTW domain-containing protein YfiP